MRSQLLLLGLAVGLAWALLGSGGVPAAHAATFTVDSQTDAVDANPGDGACATVPLPGEGVRCTLRAAVMEANALAGPDIIALPAGTYRITLTGPMEDAAATGDLDITSELTLAGAGSGATFIDGNSAVGHGPANDRVLDVLPGANATIQDVTVYGGVTPESDPLGGGGIHNRGTLALTRSTVRNSVASNRHGGGIHNRGTLTITESVVQGNATVRGAGGGILNSGTLVVRNSTIQDNRAMGLTSYLPIGGGIANVGGLTVEGSTISGNTSVIGGGGLDNAGQASVRSATISGNTTWAGPGSSIFVTQGQLALTGVTIAASSDVDGSAIVNIASASAVSLQNTIVANSGSGANCSGPVLSLGSNLETGKSCLFVLQPTDRSNTDARLGPLADNGGPTRTHALLAGSPAIDAGDTPACPPTDQRGLPRPRDGDGDGSAVCDIGAYELREPYPVDLALQVADIPDPADVGGTLTYSIIAHTVDGTLAPATVLSVTLPAGVSFGSATASQGTCQGAGPVGCSLGNVPAGTDAVVTIKVVPTGGGTVSADVRVSSALPDPDPANNSTSISTTVHAVCAPRPNAALQATRVGPGALQGTVTATRTTLQPANALRSLQVTRLDNAAIAVNGVPATAGQAVPLPTGTTSVQVVVRRVAPGPFMAHLTVTDECGAWPTFLGGGTGVP